MKCGDAAQIDPSGPDSQPRKEREDLNRRNLTLLKKHGVRLALGSDNYGSDTVPEALYLQSLNVFDNRSTGGRARAIFPHRKIGKLKEGYEASFVVLKGNPIEDFPAVQQISMAVKQGHVLQLDSPTPPNASPSK
jgi:cytosine/adenosine deaminase-related metal-dependent hydrolase